MHSTLHLFIQSSVLFIPCLPYLSVSAMSFLDSETVERELWKLTGLVWLEDFPKNQQGCIKNTVNHGITVPMTGACRISEPSWFQSTNVVGKGLEFMSTWNPFPKLNQSLNHRWLDEHERNQRNILKTWQFGASCFLAGHFKDLFPPDLMIWWSNLIQFAYLIFFTDSPPPKPDPPQRAPSHISGQFQLRGTLQPERQRSPSNASYSFTVDSTNEDEPTNLPVKTALSLWEPTNCETKKWLFGWNCNFGVLEAKLEI